MRTILTVIVVVASSYLQGCFSEASVVGMTSLKTFDASTWHLLQKISVSTAEGSESTKSIWTYQVELKAFESALVETLQLNGLLAHGRGDYILKPIFQNLQQPFFAIDMTVQADIKYVLIDNVSGKELLNETISSSYTATADDAFGPKIRRSATEGAIRANIELLIQRLATLQLN